MGSDVQADGVAVCAVEGSESEQEMADMEDEKTAIAKGEETSGAEARSSSPPGGRTEVVPFPCEMADCVAIDDLQAEAAKYLGEWTEKEQREWAKSVTAKRRGEMAEAAFVAKVSSLGMSVSKPWGDSDRYDFIVDTGKKLRRVQVKSAFRAGADDGYSFHAHGHSLRSYGAKEIDALVAYVVSEDAWYVLPASVFRRVRSLKLYPGSKKKRSKFEKYREAWGILEE
jgi:PD-(D/E)XK endonuclease